MNPPSKSIIWDPNITDYHYLESGFSKSVSIIWILIILEDPNGRPRVKRRTPWIKRPRHYYYYKQSKVLLRQKMRAEERWEDHEQSIWRCIKSASSDACCLQTCSRMDRRRFVSCPDKAGFSCLAALCPYWFQCNIGDL